MSRTTFNLSYYCRESKVNKNGLAPLELSININGERKFINLPCKLSPADFNRKRKPTDVSNLLRVWDAKVNDVITDMLSNCIPLTTDNLRNLLKTGGIESYTIRRCFDEYLNVHRKRLGVSITPKAFRKYELARDSFFKYTNPDVEVTSVTPSLMEGFYNDVCCKFNNSTSNSYLSKIKSFIKFAIDNGKLKINPFINIKPKRVVKKIEYLTDKEIKSIETHNFSTPALRRIADMFLVQVYTGLSFVDLEHIEKDDIKEMNGVYYIQKPRIKTGVTFTAPIMNEGMEIIKRYNYKLPLISNQKTNYFLKIIALEAGITKNVSTHLGRKTYGSILLNRGVRIETVAKCLGHSNVKTTQKYYAEIHKDTIIDEVKKIF